MLRYDANCSGWLQGTNSVPPLLISHDLHHPLVVNECWERPSSSIEGLQDVANWAALIWHAPHSDDIHTLFPQSGCLMAAPWHLSPIMERLDL
jgi:hypothetical protein